MNFMTDIVHDSMVDAKLLFKQDTGGKWVVDDKPSKPITDEQSKQLKREMFEAQKRKGEQAFEAYRENVQEVAQENYEYMKEQGWLSDKPPQEGDKEQRLKELRKELKPPARIKETFTTSDQQYIYSLNDKNTVQFKYDALGNMAFLNFAEGFQGEVYTNRSGDWVKAQPNEHVYVGNKFKVNGELYEFKGTDKKHKAILVRIPKASEK